MKSSNSPPEESKKRYAPLQWLVVLILLGIVIYQLYSGFYLRKVGVPGVFEVEFSEQSSKQETHQSIKPVDTLSKAKNHELQPSEGEPVELGEYLKHFMLPTGQFKPSWWIAAEPMLLPMTWVTPGVVEDPSGSSPYHMVRYAEARIKIGGKVLKQLAERPIEVLWTIELRGTKFEPEYVAFDPQPECWGLAGSGCAVNAMEVFHKAGITANALCQFQEPGSKGMLFQIIATDKSPAYVVYLYSEGSGGSSATIKLYWRGPGHTYTHTEMCDWLDKTRGWERKTDN